MDEMIKIKKAHRDGESINEIAERFNRSWATVKKVVDTPAEKLEKRRQRPNKQSKVVTSEVEKGIEAYLTKEAMLGVRKKQRYTAAVIYRELSDSGVYKGSKRQLQDAVKRLRAKHGQLKPKSYLPLNFPIGTTAQFDHGECDLEIDGQRVQGYLFVCSIPGAVLRYCQAFPVKSSEAWGEFHERSYKFFGGALPVGIYDNDSVLVKKIFGSEREQTQFSLELEEHYQIRSKFCNPASGNEKGAVENGVGYCRRNYLPGCPSFASWKEVNRKLEQDCRSNIENERHYKTGSLLKDSFDEMAKQLTPLPVSRTWCRSVEARVDSFQLAHVDFYGYSVPERFVDSRVRVNVGVFNIEIFEEHTRIAQHERRFGEPGDYFLLEHYLDQLLRKPGAFWDCQVVQQHQFYPELLDVWKRLKKKYSERKANHKFIEILRFGRRYGSKELVAAAREGARLDAVEPEAIESMILSCLSASTPSEVQVLEKKGEDWTCDIKQYSMLEGDV